VARDRRGGPPDPAQCAVYQSRHDPDEVADQAYLAALHWNRAWLVFEVTGGYGLSMARRVWKVYRYPLIYVRKPLDSEERAARGPAWLQHERGDEAGDRGRPEAGAEGGDARDP
jgi:hypothetical protein